MKCPKCGSLDTTQYDSDARRNYHMCRQCDAKWGKVHGLGHVLSIGGALLTVGAVIAGIDHMGDGGGFGDGGGDIG